MRDKVPKFLSLSLSLSEFLPIFLSHFYSVFDGVQGLVHLAASVVKVCKDCLVRRWRELGLHEDESLAKAALSKSDAPDQVLVEGSPLVSGNIKEFFSVRL